MRRGGGGGTVEEEMERCTAVEENERRRLGGGVEASDTTDTRIATVGTCVCTRLMLCCDATYSLSVVAAVKLV